MYIYTYTYMSVDLRFCSEQFGDHGGDACEDGGFGHEHDLFTKTNSCTQRAACLSHGGCGGPSGTRGAAGRRLRRPLGSRRRLPPQASRYIQGSSP